MKCLAVALAAFTKSLFQRSLSSKRAHRHRHHQVRKPNRSVLPQKVKQAHDVVRRIHLLLHVRKNPLHETLNTI